MVVEERALVKDVGDFVGKFTIYSRLRSKREGFLNVTASTFASQTNKQGVLKMTEVSDIALDRNLENVLI